MTVFNRQIATAKRLITKYGQSVVWQQIRDLPSIDSDEPWKAGGAATAVNITVKIVFIPNTRINYETLKAMIAGFEISTGQTLGYMAAQSFTPSRKDIVIRNGVQYRIEKVNELNVDGSPIIYTIAFND